MHSYSYSYHLSICYKLKGANSLYLFYHAFEACRQCVRGTIPSTGSSPRLVSGKCPLTDCFLCRAGPGPGAQAPDLDNHHLKPPVASACQRGHSTEHSGLRKSCKTSFASNSCPLSPPAAPRGFSPLLSFESHARFPASSDSAGPRYPRPPPSPGPTRRLPAQSRGYRPPPAPLPPGRAGQPPPARPELPAGRRRRLLLLAGWAPAASGPPAPSPARRGLRQGCHLGPGGGTARSPPGAMTGD